jgi:shikimate dehydrogenase
MPADRRRAAVLGHPVAHSLSPVLHLAAYSELGLDWTYERIDVTEDALPAFVDGLDEAWAGLSLTMPLKHAVLPLLDTIDPLVEVTGAANTVVLGPHGRAGHNTDVEGIQAALVEAGAGGEAEAAVLGAGATARSALAALAAHDVGRVVVAVRRPEAGEALRTTAEALGLELTVHGWSDATELLSRPLVVSTVPAGAADVLAAVVPDRPGVLLDVVYHPWPTPLAAAWQRSGGSVASGLAMLLHQAVAQVELMTGRRPATDPLRRALASAASAG